MQEIKHNILVFLGIIEELTPKEQLANLLRDSHQSTHLEDVLRIRRAGDYIPDYNRPKLYVDIHIFVGNKLLTGNTITTAKRPVCCPTDIGKWMEEIREQHKVDENRRVELNTLEQHRKLLFELKIVPFIMKRFLAVN